MALAVLASAMTELTGVHEGEAAIEPHKQAYSPFSNTKGGKGGRKDGLTLAGV
jgi:hypothetical protein